MIREQFLLTRPLRDVTEYGYVHQPFFKFLLTRPLRDVTSSPVRTGPYTIISTHTPLAGRDAGLRMRLPWRGKISTHTPLAGRDFSRMINMPIKTISTHTPLAGRDAIYTSDKYILSHFYSHAPCGT